MMDLVRSTVTCLLLIFFAFNLNAETEFREFTDSTLIQNPAAAFEYYQKQYQLTKATDDTLRKAQLLGKLGRTSVLLSNYPEGIRYLKESAALFKLLNKPKEEARQFSRLGDAFYFSKITEPKLALKYYNRAFHIFDSLGLDEIATLNYNFTGYIYWQQGKKEKALNIHLNSLEKFHDLNYLRGKTIATSDVGFTYNSLNQFGAGLEANRQALDLAYKLNDSIILTPVLNNIGVSFYGIGRLDSAHSYSIRSLHLAESKRLLLRVKEALENLKNTALAQEDYPLAFQYLNELKQAEDSLMRKEFIKEILKIEDKLKSERLLHQQQIAENETKFERSVILFSAGLLLLIIICLCIYLLYRKKLQKATERRNEILKQKNQIISNQLYQKNTLIKELHHRVKNHLQLLSSLNNIMYQSPENPELNKIISEINSRVISISEIHDQLNLGEEKQINLNRYLTSLTNNLCHSFSKEMAIKKDIDIQSVSIKTATLLGIMLTEMATNSLKHAFAEVENPTLFLKVIQKNEKLCFCLLDNGNKLPEDILDKRFESQGIEVLKIISQQLNGELRYEKEEGWNGYCLEFEG